jgi:hypothetical protein
MFSLLFNNWQNITGSNLTTCPATAGFLLEALPAAMEKQQQKN